MVKYYNVSAHNFVTMDSFLSEVISELKSNNLLATEVIILRDGDLEMVIGASSSQAFNNPSIVDEIALHMTPMIYEHVGFLAPDKRYYSVGIAPNTTLWRLIHNDNQIRKPLFAMNAVHMHFDGYWRDIDMTRPQQICPTLGVMGIKAGQIINFRDLQTPLDNLDCRTINMFEFTRLGSIAEMVVRRERHNPRSYDPLVDEFMQIVMEYRADRARFLQLMLRGRVLITLGFLVYLLAVDNHLMFGHSEKKLLERFLETLGVPATHLQWLERSNLHHQSTAYLLSQPHYERDEVFPFLIEFNKAVHHALLNHVIQAYQVQA